jgi:DNA replication factor GINS
VSQLISDVLKKLLEFTKMELDTEELQKPQYESYAQLIQEINNKLSAVGILDKELLESMRGMVREALATLVMKRMEKIMRYYKAGKTIQQELLFAEERRFLVPFLELRITEQREGRAEGLALVSFRKGFPTLYSVRLISLGPFSQFDLAVLPRTDAEELMRRGVIDIVR